MDVAGSFAAKGPRSRSHGQMKQYNSGAPFERVAMDVAGPFPISKLGNRQEQKRMYLSTIKYRYMVFQ